MSSRDKKSPSTPPPQGKKPSERQNSPANAKGKSNEAGAKDKSNATKHKGKVPDTKKSSGCCRRCLPYLLGCVIVVAVLLTIVKRKHDEKKHPPGASCVDWEGSTCHLACKASFGPVIPYDMLHRGFSTDALMLDLRANCHKCPAGWALIDGPPQENRTFTSVGGHRFVWNNHCAELLHEEERQVLMIRHGQSTWNLLMETWLKLPGIGGAWVYKDAPLSKLGLQQTQRLANILRKASAKVYPSDTEAEVGHPELSTARSELGKVNLEEEVVISDKIANKTVTDEEMVQNLASDKNRLELDVLLGRKCEDTNFVSSPLARAMDTLLIGTMERFRRCPTRWQVSSNLQEIEHNKDCEPNLQPGRVPEFVEEQHGEYAKAGINGTARHVVAMYQKSDTARHGAVKSAYDRLRLFDQSSQMLAELDATFSSQRKFNVWAGHSIWFRVFFQYFADLSNTDCKALTTMKVANTAIVSVQLRRLKNSPRKYVAHGCKFIHLGSDKVYKIKGKKKKAEVKAAKEKKDVDHSGIPRGSLKDTKKEM